MKYILQVFSGFRNAGGIRAEDVIRKIDDAASRIETDKVIIGWNADASLYKKVGVFLHQRGIRMLLWLPVFSEVDEAFRPDPAADVFGRAVQVPLQHDGETFQFVCPSSGRNAQIAKETFGETFSGCGFDGVFLDRIRSQSFEAGVSGVLSCGCGRCRKAFLEKGVDLEEVGKLYEEKKDAFFDTVSWPVNGQFVLENPVAQHFFEAKEEIIAEAVNGLAEYFKGKGLTVGLDLFAPAVSRFVGQNYAMISKHADFIKPMLYRRTEAPAGVAYELALFEKHAPGARGRMKRLPDLPFLHTQLQAIEELPCAKYPGIEINYDPKLAKTDEAYIRESVNAVREHGFEGAVLCWNLMNAPEEHIEAVAAAEKG